MHWPRTAIAAANSSSLDAAYPAQTAIKLILNNHSAHKHGSWLHLVEGFFSKLARSVLRHVRIASKRELKDRLHTWAYKLDKAA
jgi:hypothetical protein